MKETLKRLGRAVTRRAPTVLYAPGTKWALLKELTITNRGPIPNPSTAPTLTAQNTGGTVPRVTSPAGAPALTAVGTGGTLVGVPTPSVGPALVNSTTGGTLRATTWFVRYTIVDSAGKETAASPEASIATSGTTSSINVNVTLPPGALYIKVYVSATTGQNRYVGRSNDGSGTFVITEEAPEYGTPGNTITRSATTGGTLSPGSYSIRYALVDKFGNVSIPSGLQSALSVSAPNNAISISLSVPTSATKVQWFLAPVGTTSGHKLVGESNTTGGTALYTITTEANPSMPDVHTSASTFNNVNRSGQVSVLYSFVDTHGLETAASPEAMAQVTGGTASVTLDIPLPAGAKNIRVYAAYNGDARRLIGTSPDGSGAFTVTNMPAPGTAPPAVDNSGWIFARYTFIDDLGNESLPSPEASVRVAVGNANSVSVAGIRVPIGATAVRLYISPASLTNQRRSAQSVSGTIEPTFTVTTLAPVDAATPPATNTSGAGGTVEVWLFVTPTGTVPNPSQALIGKLRLSEGETFTHNFNTIIPANEDLIVVASDGGCTITATGVEVG